MLLADDDAMASNTLADPERVGLRTLDAAALDSGVLRVEVPAVSWAAIRLA